MSCLVWLLDIHRNYFFVAHHDNTTDTDESDTTETDDVLKVLKSQSGWWVPELMLVVAVFSSSLELCRAAWRSTHHSADLFLCYISDFQKSHCSSSQCQYQHPDIVQPDPTLYKTSFIPMLRHEDRLIKHLRQIEIISSTLNICWFLLCNLDCVIMRDQSGYCKVTSH